MLLLLALARFFFGKNSVSKGREAREGVGLARETGLSGKANFVV